MYKPHGWTVEKILYAGGLYCMGKLPLEDQFYGNH